MGSYTSSQKFYKPDAGEFVDVESQVNYNLRRADSRVRSLVEWQYVAPDHRIGDEFTAREPGMKYYQAATNALIYSNASNVLSQDSFSQVLSWSTSGITFSGGYQSENTAEQTISYSIDSVGGHVRWRGSMKLNAAADEIPRNTNIVVMSIPSGCIPARGKYFTVHMGIVSGGYSICRILFKTDGNVEINRMGYAMTDPTQRNISFNDIFYSLGDV